MSQFRELVKVEQEPLRSFAIVHFNGSQGAAPHDPKFLRFGGDRAMLKEAVEREPPGMEKEHIDGRHSEESRRQSVGRLRRSQDFRDKSTDRAGTQRRSPRGAPWFV
jgi:hypothetical protein